MGSDWLNGETRATTRATWWSERAADERAARLVFERSRTLPRAVAMECSAGTDVVIAASGHRFRGRVSAAGPDILTLTMPSAPPQHVHLDVVSSITILGSGAEPVRAADPPSFLVALRQLELAQVDVRLAIADGAHLVAPLAAVARDHILVETGNRRALLATGAIAAVAAMR